MVKCGNRHLREDQLVTLGNIVSAFPTFSGVHKQKVCLFLLVFDS